MGIATKVLLLIVILAAIAAAGEYLPKLIPKEKILEFYKETSESVERYKEKIAAVIYIKKVGKKGESIEFVRARTPKPRGTILKPAPTKRTESRIVREFGITGGTFFDREGGSRGTSFLIQRTSAFGTITTVDIYGPSGWNGDKPFRCNSFLPPGISKDLSLCWQIIPPVMGYYKAQTVVKGKKLEAHFFIRKESFVDAPRITHAKAYKGRVTVRWNAPGRTQSFLVMIATYPSYNILASAVVSGNIRSKSFEKPLPLVKGRKYIVTVCAFSKDVKTPVTLTDPFNIGAHTVIFRGR